MSEEELISIKNRLDKILNSGKEPVYCEELITTGELQRLLEEIERLNNIITELEKWLNEYWQNIPNHFGESDILEEVLDKLKELKEHNMGHNTQNETQKEKV